MYRTHTCGALRIEDVEREVALCGWVRRSRDLGGMTFMDLRDRYGVTQAVFDMEDAPELCQKARSLGREYVVRIEGRVRERSNKNPKLPTGEVEVLSTSLEVLNPSRLPPFKIEEETDGGEELRMRYRMLDLRRPPLQRKLELRHRMAMATRNYLDRQGFLEIETPVLIRSTPEGARDFIVPSRLHHGEFYALPQSPQTFKQLLMIGGADRYFQLVKCFRDEDLRADRQPEFTQIDCEMAFVDKEGVMDAFEGLARHLFWEVKEENLPAFPIMNYDEAIRKYGTDRPDLRFGMEFVELTDLAQGKGFRVFDDAGLVVGILVEGWGEISRKELDQLQELVTSPQIGAKGLVSVRSSKDGNIRSSVDKFFGKEDLDAWMDRAKGEYGDLLLILAGDADHTRYALGQLRLEIGERMGARDPSRTAPLWIVDFPMFERDPDQGTLHPMHHPFTTPKEEDRNKLTSDPENVRAEAYDMVINGVEIGGGSLRIHERTLQEEVFRAIGMNKAEYEDRFGSLLHALEQGAPPHGGIAFGFDRWVALMDGSSDIRDHIAFPKNNAGRDLMIEAPAPVDREQLEELGLSCKSDNDRA
ncbi:MAG: aspartate--tRNA ligase [Flavobacteriales bacterium]